MEQFHRAASDLVATYLSRTDPDFELGGLTRDALFKLLKAKLEASHTLLPRSLQNSLPLLVNEAPPEAQPFTTAEVKARVLELSAATAWLERVVERVPVTKVHAERTLRWLSLVVAIVAVPLAAFVWHRWPVNVALHKPVQASSIGFNTHPEGATNGSLWPSPDFHTQLQDHPYLVIDLGQLYYLTDAEIWNRRDCCPDQSVPMEFQISEDGANYVTIARREEPFNLEGSWTIESIGRKARYVRVQSMRETYLTLNEVWVFGRPAT